jgi:hypothetical protein
MPLFKSKSEYNNAASSKPEESPTPKPTTAEDWQRVCDHLQEDITSANTLVAGIDNQITGLALDAELGDPEAKTKIAQLRKDADRIERDAVLKVAALSHGRIKLKETAQKEAEQRKAQRREAIQSTLRQYMAGVRTVDQKTMDLVHAHVQARALLDKAMDLMTPQERVPFTQLMSKWGGTLSVAHYGLDQFVSLGPEAQFRHHRQSYEDFATPFCGDTYNWGASAQPPAPPPNNEPEFVSESEALSRPRPKVN